MNRWTHTATVTRAYAFGPQQMPSRVSAGQQITLLRDPAGAAAEGQDVVYAKAGRACGVVRIADLTEIRPA